MARCLRRRRASDLRVAVPRWYPIAMRRLLAGSLLAAGLCPAAIQFRDQVLEADLGIGYAVLCVDVDADGDTDVVALSEDKVAWWSNPGWEKHVILDGATEADNVAIAAHDITGDGKPEFAIGAAWRPERHPGRGNAAVDPAPAGPVGAVAPAPDRKRAYDTPHPLGRHGWGQSSRTDRRPAPRPRDERAAALGRQRCPTAGAVARPAGRDGTMGHGGDP